MRCSFCLQHIKCISNGFNRREKSRKRIESNVETKLFQVLCAECGGLVAINNADNLGTLHALGNRLNFSDLLDTIDKNEIGACILIEFCTANGFVDALALDVLHENL